jgi:predicted Zn-dependent protease with MMP-like domain
VGHNSAGSYRTTRELAMRAYDTLPREVRDALKEAVADFVPQPLVTDMRQGASIAALLKRVEGWDAVERSRSFETTGRAPRSRVHRKQLR